MSKTKVLEINTNKARYKILMKFIMKILLGTHLFFIY